MIDYFYAQLNAGNINLNMTLEEFADKMRKDYDFQSLRDDIAYEDYRLSGSHSARRLMLDAQNRSAELYNILIKFPF